MPSCWFIFAGMWLFVYDYVSADSWDGFAEKNNKKDYFLTRQWSIEIVPEISLPPCIDEGVVWGFSWLGATGGRFCHKHKTQKGPAKCVYCVWCTLFPSCGWNLCQFGRHHHGLVCRFCSLRKHTGTVLPYGPHFNADLDPGSTFRLMRIRIRIFYWMRIRGYSSKCCESATTVLQTLYASILSLHASIFSVQGLRWLQLETQKLLNVDFDADPNPSSQNKSNPDRRPSFLIVHTNKSVPVNLLICCRWRRRRVK